MVQYDPSVIQMFADRLYARATVIALLYALLGAGVGAAAGVTINRELELGWVGLGLPLILFAGIGAWLGHERGFSLRLQAQQALCHVKTEEAARWLATNAPTARRPGA